jgi:putative membrane protein
MLLVHPVHEVLRQLPFLIGTVAVGSATGNPLWAVAALALTLAMGAARWFTTTYRIAPDEVQLRAGLLQRKALSLPRNRIRSVSTDARLLHRLLGLTILRVSTGQEAHGDDAFALDAVEAGQVPRLRAVLLADSLMPAPDAPPQGRMLARWEPSWLRYSPLSFTGLAMIAAAAGVLYQAGGTLLLSGSHLAEDGREVAGRYGLLATAAGLVGVVLVASVVLSVLRSLVTYGNLALRRDAELLHLQHGLLRRREHTFDMRRLRGGTLREPLLVRIFGGARLDAVMTGVGGAGEASLLLPPCPAGTAGAVLAELIGRPDDVSGPLRRHGPAAARRRWTRALTGPAVMALALVVASFFIAVPVWVWPLLAGSVAVSAGLAADRVAALGHRVGDGWLVARAGSVERRRDCIAGDGIVGWTVRQSYFQRRAGVATLIAATAAGEKAYRVIDVPAPMAWSIAAEASPWLRDAAWACR